jgi:hypothetical protein
MESGNSPEIRRQVITKESVTNVFALAKEIKPLINNRSDEAAQQTKDFLDKICPGAGYTEFGQVLDASRNSNLGEQKQIELKQAVDNVGGALLIAGGDRIFDWANKGELDSHMTQGMAKLSEVVDNNLFIDGENDEIGKFIVRELSGLEKLNQRALQAPNVYTEDRLVKEKQVVIEGLLDKYDDQDEGSDEAIKLNSVVGAINETIVVLSKKDHESSEKGNKKIDLRLGLVELLEKGDPQEILNYSRRLLDTLENSTYRSNDISIGNITRPINDILDKLRIRMVDEEEKELMFNDVHREITARLALHDTAFYMDDSGFRMPERGGGLSEAAGKALSDGRELTQDVLQFLLRDAKDKKFNLPISAAWNLIEDANFNYEDLLNKVADDLGYEINSSERKSLVNLEEVNVDYGEGTTVEGQKIGYFLDSNKERKKKVDAFIVKSISKDGGDGVKAYQLASKLVTASGERSVFNFGLVNGDNFAETIHFAYFRADDARKGKNTGAMSNRGIQSLTLGWFRDMSSERKIGKLKAEEIWVEECKEKLDFAYYFTQTMSSKVATAKAAFMDSSPSPKILESGVSHFNGLVDVFAKLDPPLDLVEISGKYLQIETEIVINSEGKKSKKRFIKGIDVESSSIVKKGGNYEVTLKDGRVLKSEKAREGRNNLRSMYALGLLELIGTKPSLGWDIKKIMELRKIMVETNLSGTAKPFLNEGMWNWINEQTIAHDEERNYNFQKLMALNRRSAGRMAFWDGFFKGIAGRK